MEKVQAARAMTNEIWSTFMLMMVRLGGMSDKKPERARNEVRPQNIYSTAPAAPIDCPIESACMDDKRTKAGI
jgi:hypothetical protein